jgi:hypothetical protein
MKPSYRSDGCFGTAISHWSRLGWSHSNLGTCRNVKVPYQILRRGLSLLSNLEPTCDSGLCHNFAGIAVQRFILGCLESVTTPAFILITSVWYTRSEQPLRVSTWWVSAALFSHQSSPESFIPSSFRAFVKRNNGAITGHERRRDGFRRPDIVRNGVYKKRSPTDLEAHVRKHLVFCHLYSLIPPPLFLTDSCTLFDSAFRDPVLF